VRERLLGQFQQSLREQGVPLEWPKPA
jgi:hypothetical protein